MEIMTKAELAQAFKVDPRTVRNWMKQGMPHMRNGAVLRYDPADVKEWLLTTNNYSKKGAAIMNESVNRK